MRLSERRTIHAIRIPGRLPSARYYGNHFPTPGIGAGLLVAACAQGVVALRATGRGTPHRVGQHAKPGCGDSAPASPVAKSAVAVIAALAVAGLIITAAVALLIVRRRHAVR